MKKYAIFLFCFLLLNPEFSLAEIIEEAVSYEQGGATLEGWLVYDDSIPGKRPGILVVHAWKGLGDYVKMRARKLAQLGYAAFAADIYGKGVYAKNSEEAGKLAGIYKNDRILTRERVLAGLHVLKHNGHVDAAQVAAIGYCFGGMVVLELARSGADLSGVVTFHGSLATPMPAEPGKIKEKILVLHGASDPFVTPQEVAAFKDEMKKAGAAMQFVSYEGAVHSFTDPESGDDPTKGAAYNQLADEKSWEAMKQFFSEIFSPLPAVQP